MNSKRKIAQSDRKISMLSSSRSEDGGDEAFAQTDFERLAHHSGLGIYPYPHVPCDCQPAPILVLLQDRCMVQSSVHPRFAAT